MSRKAPDRVASPLSRLAALLVPPLCPGCGRALGPARLLCAGCLRELNRAPVLRDDPPEGISAVVSCAAHEGVARRVLAAYKFRGITRLEQLIGGYMADVAGPMPPATILVPVPASPWRRRRRGFDPAGLLAARIAAVIEEAELRTGSLERRDRNRQRGRTRASRLANPPGIRPAPGAAGLDGRPVTVVDDVITTGATLSTVAAALDGIAAGPVRAVSFTRRL